MNRWAFVRVAAYLTLGAGLACGLLAIRSYPGERTLVDTYRDWKAQRSLEFHEVRRDCKWRPVLCEELPSFSGPLAAATDSLLEGVERMQCERWPVDACWAERADTIVHVAYFEDGWVMDIARQWAPPDLDQEYWRQHERMRRQYGESFLCPQSDALGVQENRRWQLTTTNLGVIKDGGRLEIDQAAGRIYCHTL